MIVRAFSPLVSFLRWVFGPCAPWLDLVLAFPALCWAALLIARPEVFERGNWAKIGLLPSEAWLVIMVGLGAVHLICVAQRLHSLRIVAAAGSAWCWLFIAYVIGRNGITPGTILHAELGLIALFGGLHLYSSPRRP
ncbi:hypothetical protein ABE438_14540 [Bosea sp. TWI1241]|uniref:hypothetical protein n=1 Tax=Bosea sp. TWI1241 TaxID=3148904 RepID=UPI0032096AE4